MIFVFFVFLCVCVVLLCVELFCLYSLLFVWLSVCRLVLYCMYMLSVIVYFWCCVCFVFA